MKPVHLMMRGRSLGGFSPILSIAVLSVVAVAAIGQACHRDHRRLGRSIIGIENADARWLLAAAPVYREDREAILV